MQNPFDEEDRDFLVLVNDEKQYSLWPANIEVPGGWAVTHGPDTRAACLTCIEEQWIDMRPASLANVSGAPHSGS